MSGSSAPMPQNVLSLTEEEAFALLEMCVLTLAAEHPTHLLVLSRLGSLCRELLKKQTANEEPVTEHRSPSDGHGALKRTRRLRRLDLLAAGQPTRVVRREEATVRAAIGRD